MQAEAEPVNSREERCRLIKLKTIQKRKETGNERQPYGCFTQTERIPGHHDGMLVDDHAVFGDLRATARQIGSEPYHAFR